ncbi:MAG: 3-keto-5-aminohexanoate cleavage protein [Gaiellaceae bacterium]
MDASLTWNYTDTYEYLERVRGGFPPLMITCALNGGIQGKEGSEALPEKPEELAQQAREAYEAGAVAVHVHPRDPSNWTNTASDPDDFFEANARIRELCPDLIINNTTGGGPSWTMETRFRIIEADPELASLNMGPDMSRFVVKPRPASFEHPHDGFVYDDCIPFTYAIIEELAGRMRERGIKPEMEIYQPGQFWVTQSLIEKELVEPPYLHQFVMGYQTSSFATPQALLDLVRELPEHSIFFVCGVGTTQLPMTTTAMLLGGHVRVGLEDNLYYARGRKFRGNGEAVERAVRIARELNREIATPAQAREMLGISATPSTYAVKPSERVTTTTPS